MTEYALVLGLVGVLLLSLAWRFWDQVPGLVDELIDVLVFRMENWIPRGVIGAFTYF